MIATLENAPTLGVIRRHSGVAGQYSLTVDVTYVGESARAVTFVGSTFGGPILMRTDAWETWVTEPGRFGAILTPEWVRAFFGLARA